jgi:hypothetical protein
VKKKLKLEIKKIPGTVHEELSMSLIIFGRILYRLIIVSNNICRAFQNTFHVKYISFSDNLPLCVTIMNDNERT